MKNIIVGIDFSANSINSLRHAVAISLKTNLPIHLVWVKTPGAAKGLGKGTIDDFTAIAQLKLEDLAHRCHAEAPHVQIVTVILEGKPFIELTKYAANQPGSILIMGTHGMSGFEEKFVGGNAFKTVAESTVPTLVLRESIKVNHDLIEVLVPIDTSFETLQKMRHAIVLAKIFSAKIVLLGILAINSKEEKHIVTIQLKHAVRMCERANVRHEAQQVIVSGNAAKSILDYAKNRDINLMVIMKEEEVDIVDFWSGNTTRQLLNTAPMPLLIIPNINQFSVSR